MKNNEREKRIDKEYFKLLKKLKKNQELLKCPLSNSCGRYFIVPKQEQFTQVEFRCPYCGIGGTVAII